MATLTLSACGASDEAASDDEPVAEESATDAGSEAAEAAEADDDAEVSDAPDADAVESDAPASGLQQNGPVSVDGDLLAPFTSTDGDPAVGVAAPVVSGESFDGSPIVIGGETDAPTLVVFLAHWCPHCNDEIPVLVGMENDGLMPDGLDVVGVSTAVQADADNFPPSDWIVDNDWPWPVLADDEELAAIASMGGTSFPFAVVLDSDGTVLARRAGGASAEDTVEFLNAALANAAG